MKARRATRRVMTAFGLAFLAISWSQAAHAQVKLQYKFPESKTLKYKTNSKMTHILTLAGQEFETRNDETMVKSTARSGRNVPMGACRSRKKSNHCGSSWQFQAAST